MQTKITTTITTTIDLDTLEPEHDVHIDCTDNLPIDAIKAAVVGACKNVIHGLEKGQETVTQT